MTFRKYTHRPPARAYADAREGSRDVLFPIDPDYLSDARLSCWRLSLYFGFPFTKVLKAMKSLRPEMFPCPVLANVPSVVTPSTAVGYDDSNRRFIIRNSWGASWGIRDIVSCHMNICLLRTSRAISGPFGR